MVKDDKFFWFRENRLVIDGVQGEHVFLHVTDTHINVCDEQCGEEDKKKYDEQEALWAKYKRIFAEKSDEPYDEPQAIPTIEAFEKQLALAEEMKPETLLLSGDNMDFVHPAAQRYLKKRFGEYSGKFISVPGNHEEDSCDGVWEEGTRCYEYEGFRIVAVDDSKNTVSRKGLDDLKALCDEGIPIIILCHVPICTPCCKEDLSRLDPYFYIDRETADENACEFVTMCETNDTIKAILCGHTHGYTATEIAPGKPMIIGSQGMAGAVHIFTVTG